MRKLLGIIFITLGALIILSMVDPQLHSRLEPLFFPVVLALVMLSAMITSKRIQLIPSLIFLGAVLWILRELDVIQFDSLWQFFWPSILILIGVRILFSRSPIIRVSNNVGVDVAFGGREQAFSEAKSTTITTMFGSNEIDYRNAKFPDHVVELDIVTMFGSTEIRVGDDVRVIADGTPILGGFENKTNNQGDKVLKIKYTVMFGAIEIHR
jgi:predicted membrane protein